MNYYLGFDAGTQSVKVAVYDEDMNCIVSSSCTDNINLSRTRLGKHGR